MLILTKLVRVNLTESMAGFTAELFCRLRLSQFLLWGLMMSSSYNLMAISFERYMAIVHPIWHRNYVCTDINIAYEDETKREKAKAESLQSVSVSVDTPDTSSSKIAQTSEKHHNAMNRQNESAEKNVIKTLVVVTACYFICWLPNKIYIALYAMGVTSNLILSVANAPPSTIDDIISSMIFLQRNGNVAVFFYPNANSMVYQGICFNKITCSYSFNI